MYQRFNVWLARELVWWKMPYYCVLAALLMWSMDQIVFNLIYHPLGISVCGPQRFVPLQNEMSIIGARIATPLVSFTDFWKDHFPVFFEEEIYFRVPLFFAAFIPPIVVPVALLNSMLFGLAHCGDVYDFSNIGIQGIGGMILSVMFLKFGGMQRNLFKGLKGLTASLGTHTLFMFGLWAFARL